MTKKPSNQATRRILYKSYVAELRLGSTILVRSSSRRIETMVAGLARSPDISLINRRGLAHVAVITQERHRFVAIDASKRGEYEALFGLHMRAKLVVERVHNSHTSQSSTRC